MAAGAAGTGGGICFGARSGRREHGQLLFEVGRAAARAIGNHARAHQRLELLAALVARVFVDGHGVYSMTRQGF